MVVTESIPADDAADEDDVKLRKPVNGRYMKYPNLELRLMAREFPAPVN